MNKLGYLLIILLTACATQIPLAIKRAPENNPSLMVVQTGVSDFNGAVVRWGGEITKIDNRASYTLVEVLERELNSYGKPIDDSGSNGRFVVRFPGFVDPAVYGIGRLLTVAGTINGELKGAIGEFNYSFPVIVVTSSYMWEKQAQSDWPPPWYYDPWYYDPWYYPYPPWPYRHR